jgi:DNA polymerase V
MAPPGKSAPAKTCAGKPRLHPKAVMLSAIALVDANNFYVSCERLFRPDLRQRPVVVLSNNDGCIVSRSNEAKAVGIKMGEPAFKCRDLLDLHNIAVFSSNYALYGDLSQRMFGILKEFSPIAEYYSIDEAFIELQAEDETALEHLGRTIRQRIEGYIGIPVSIGIATTKTLAKVAAYHAKHSAKTQGVLSLVNSPFLDLALERLPIEEVWGLGRNLSRRLLGRGFVNALKLRKGNDAELKRVLNVIGMRTIFELRGIPCFPLELGGRPRKMIIVSRSFGEPVYDFEHLAAAISYHIIRAGEKLRRSGQVAGQLSVYIRTNRFRAEDERYANELTVPLAPKTDTTPELLKRALEALRQIYRPNARYAKAGIMLTDLSAAEALPMRLWGNEAYERSGRLMRALDELNARFGRDAVSFGVQDPAARWQMKCDSRSPQYTTRWEDLLIIGKKPLAARQSQLETATIRAS